MRNTIKTNLIGNAAIYALANILNGVIPFLLLPILTRVFTPEEYGLVTLFSAVIAVMGAFTGLSVHGAVSVKFFDKTIEHPKFVGACLLVLGGSTSVVLMVLLILGDQISNLIHLPKKWLLIAAIVSAAQFVINIRLTMWQVQNQAIRYGFFQVTQTLFNLGISLALVFWVLMGWEGRAWGIVAAIILFAALAIITLSKENLFFLNDSKKYIKGALTFGVPLIPHTVGGLLIAMSDRIVLSSVLDLTSVGIYSVGMQMAMVIGLFADALVKSYGPFLYSGLADASFQDYKIVRNTYGIFILFIFLALLYSQMLPLIYSIFIGKGYQDALTTTVLASFAYAFQGMYYTVVGFLFYKEKTGRLSILTICCGVLNVCLIYLLVGSYGITGAAWSFLIVQIIFFLGAWYLAQKAHHMPWFEMKVLKKNLL